MRKVLITGGYGFVGSALSMLLAQRGDCKVTVLDNLLSGDRLTLPNVSFIRGDVRDSQLLRTTIPNYDVVVHLAAIVGAPACAIDPEFSYEVNVLGTQNVIQAMRPNQSLVYTSTSSVYGSVPSAARVHEEYEAVPINDYARQKLYTEELVRLSGIPYTIFRPVTAFGVTERIRLDLLVNTMIYEALTARTIRLFEPEIIRPMVSVYDFARALMFAALGVFPQNEVFNLGDPRFTVTKRELAENIAGLCGASVSEIEETSLDPRNYFVDFGKLHLYGFRCESSGLREAVASIQANLVHLQENPKSFSTPALVQAFLSRNHV